MRADMGIEGDELKQERDKIFLEQVRKNRIIDNNKLKVRERPIPQHILEEMALESRQQKPQLQQDTEDSIEELIQDIEPNQTVIYLTLYVNASDHYTLRALSQLAKEGMEIGYLDKETGNYYVATENGYTVCGRLITKKGDAFPDYHGACKRILERYEQEFNVKLDIKKVRYRKERGDSAGNASLSM